MPIGKELRPLWAQWVPGLCHEFAQLKKFQFKISSAHIFAKALDYRIVGIGYLSEFSKLCTMGSRPVNHIVVTGTKRTLMASLQAPWKHDLWNEVHPCNHVHLMLVMQTTGNPSCLSDRETFRTILNPRLGKFRSNFLDHCWFILLPYCCGISLGAIYSFHDHSDMISFVKAHMISNQRLTFGRHKDACIQCWR